MLKRAFNVQRTISRLQLEQSRLSCWDLMAFWEKNAQEEMEQALVADGFTSGYFHFSWSRETDPERFTLRVESVASKEEEQ